MSGPAGFQGMDAWQSRMRDMKKQERMQKTQTAEMHREYRGGLSEGDRKLAALKQEERKKMQDAEKMWRAYQCNTVEARKEKKKRQDPDHPYPPVTPRIEDDAIDYIRSGAVSQLKEKFNSDGGRDGPFHFSISELANMTDAERNELADVYAELQKKVDKENALSYIEEEKKLELASSNEPDEETGRVESAVDSIDSTAASTPLKAIGGSNTLDSFDGTVPADHSPVVRLDINYSFGLITATDHPQLDGYMSAVEEIVLKVLNQKPDFSKHVAYDPSNGPFLTELGWDESFKDPMERPGVKRALVTASVPVFLADNSEVNPVRDEIVVALQHAINSGSFLEIAHGVA